MQENMKAVLDKAPASFIHIAERLIAGDELDSDIYKAIAHLPVGTPSLFCPAQTCCGNIFLGTRFICVPFVTEKADGAVKIAVSAPVEPLQDGCAELFPDGKGNTG